MSTTGNTIESPSIVWLLGEFILGVLLCGLPAVAFGLSRESLLLGAVLAAAVLVPSEFLRQFVGPAATLALLKHVPRGKETANTENAESNRMLSLAFQQNRPNMAFETFRTGPLDETVRMDLRDLVIAIARRRRSMATYDDDAMFRELAERMGLAKEFSEAFGELAAGPANAGTRIQQGGAQEKPMLGRYQIEGELGRGAMGMVYGGKDAKTGREVAIKTMVFTPGLEADVLADAKKLFFRAAETAGRLNHPNIVTIFDAGEERDLSFIAMEFLRGKDLVQYTKFPNLLPTSKVLSIVERVAQALDYAHSKGVVHGDIGPANITYDPESDTVKVTDFGTANITDTRTTLTGASLGDASYMSPEQVIGTMVDGRSDLFSLGVVLYQLLSGRLPFNDNSMTLQWNIVNSQPDPIRDVNPALPRWIEVIINKALAKSRDSRFQTGAEFANAIRQMRAGTAEASINSPR